MTDGHKNTNQKFTDYEVGYGKPPAPTRFQKGRSGNRKGRRPGGKKELPYEAVLGQMVTMREDGIERQVTAEEAFVLHMTQIGLKGDGSAVRITMVALEKAREAKVIAGDDGPLRIEIVLVQPGSVNSGLTALGMGRKLDRLRPSARTAIEPWLVQQALDRLGDRRLTREEQETVVQATRTPHKVKWPEWWEVRP